MGVGIIILNRKWGSEEGDEGEEFMHTMHPLCPSWPQVRCSRHRISFYPETVPLLAIGILIYRTKKWLREVK